MREPLEQTQRQVRVQVPLVRLIHDDHVKVPVKMKTRRHSNCPYGVFS